jgi:hypothetical protein
MGTLTQTTVGLIYKQSFEGTFNPTIERSNSNQSAAIYGGGVDGSKYYEIDTEEGYHLSASWSADLGSSPVKYIGVWQNGFAYGGYGALYVGSTETHSKGWSYPGSQAFTWGGWVNISSKNGTQTLKMYGSGGDGTPYHYSEAGFDCIVILSGLSITVTNLQTGQKIEIYKADDTLVGSATVGGGQTSVSIDVSSITIQPFAGYIKVYDINGSTLLYTLPTQNLSGGDSFSWSWGASYMTGPATSLRIYKQGGGGSPQSQSITVTLKSLLDDSPIQDKTITFTTSLGSVSPSSASTDSNGQASTTLTSGSTHGWAVVKASWVGDGNAGPSSCFVEVAVYDAPDSGDSSKGYQLFIQGIEYAYTSGSYTKVIDFQPQRFDIELAEVEASVDGALEIIIYHRGVKDFVGRILQITRTADKRMKLTGLSNHWKLTRRLANKSYTGDPNVTINDLLVRYPAGVSAGTIGMFGNNIPITFSWDSLLAAIQRLLDLTGWKARLNVDDTLDFAPTFGTSPSVTFETGVANIEVVRETDYSRVNTRTILIGSPSTLVSDYSAPTGAAVYGHVEQMFSDKNVTTQAALDLEDQQILAACVNAIERISGNFIDLSYAADLYDIFDSVIVIDTEMGLSGEYQIVALTRDMTDKGSVSLELSTLAVTFSDQVAKLARTVKDLVTE